MCWYPQAARKPTKGFWPGNLGFRALVMHIAQDHDHDVSPFLQSAGDRSTHFYVLKDGTIDQFVSTDDSAWANGLSWEDGHWIDPEDHVCHPSWSGLLVPVNPNRYTVSMEHEGDYSEPWTQPMFDATVALMRWLAPLKGVQWWQPGVNLIGHCDISPIDRPNCPGPHCDLQALALAANRRAYRCRVTAIVYEVPSPTIGRVAKNGAAHLNPGDLTVVDMGYPNGMLHLADGAGFVQGEWMEAVS